MERDKLYFLYIHLNFIKNHNLSGGGRDRLSVDVEKIMLLQINFQLVTR